MRRWIAMNITLEKALIALVPTCVLLFGSMMLLTKCRAVFSIFQSIGAVCLVLVVLAHVAEALRWFPAMRWGKSTALGTTLICRLRFSVSRCFHSVTSFRHSVQLAVFVRLSVRDEEFDWTRPAACCLGLWRRNRGVSAGEFFDLAQQRRLLAGLNLKELSNAGDRSACFGEIYGSLFG